MDRLNLLYSKSYKNQFKNFKHHIILEIFKNFNDSDILKLKGFHIREIVKTYIKNSKYDKNTNPIQVNYYLARGWNKDEAYKKIKEIQSKNANKLHKKRKETPENYKEILSPYTIKFWTNKGYSEEVAKFKIKESRSTNIEHWLSKGFTKSESLEIITKLQKEKSNIFLNKKSKNPEKFKNILPIQKQYWLDRGYTEKEAQKIIREKQATFSLKKCIQKYGEKKGTQIFNERQIKWKKSLHQNFKNEGDNRSPSSKFANLIINKICSHLNIEIPNKEKWMKNKNTGKAYSYDFTYNKKIIEFNGDYWHCNPNIYGLNYYNKSKKSTAQQIWKYDKDKINFAKSKGYQVLVIWESEYQQKPETTINKCIEYLKD